MTPKIFTRVPTLIIFLITVAVGVLIGTGGYTFWYGRGYSYLSDAPEVCLNCHIMRDNFNSWSVSSHRGVSCNDCHLPHGLVLKYVAKAENGFRHSAAFTLEDVQVLRATAKTHRHIQGNCIRCHGAMAGTFIRGQQTHEISCTRCHYDVGHIS